MSLSKEAAALSDALDEDKPVANQKFVCLSFLSPEKIIKDKKMFFFDQFVKTFEYTKSVELYNNFIGYISYKYNLNSLEVQSDLKEFIEKEKEKLQSVSVEDDFKNFLDNNEERLQEKFDNERQFKTNTRGIKIRGSYNAQGEAEMRAKMLRESDPAHDVYVGQVGVWTPFDPDAYKTGKVEYLEKELNELMHEKNKNEESAKVEFDNRVKEAKKKAIEDNVKKAEESGNTLSEVMDESGNLVNLRAVDYDAIPDEDVIMDPSNDLKNEIFKKSNIPTSDK
eukprot:g9637.t1